MTAILPMRPAPPEGPHPAAVLALLAAAVTVGGLLTAHALGLW